MIKCKYFRIQELVDKTTFDKFGEEAWMFFNPLALVALDGIREFFKSPIVVNNWASGGSFQARGLRLSYQNVGGIWSQHRFGNAFDCTIAGVDAETVRMTIFANQNNPLLINITCIEDDVTWLHFDCRNISNRIKIVRP